MKTNYRFFYLILLLVGFSFTACDDDNEATPEENNAAGTVNGDMYFPPVGSDEWEKVSATELGWDTTDLSDAIRYARDNRSYNLMIIHKGKIVVEEYWRETNAASLHEINSIAKSMMAFVVGILQSEGALGLDDKVSDYLPAGWSQSPNTESQITIRHLLTMTSGLNEDLLSVGTPGEEWRYSHAAYKILFEVVKTVKGSSARDYFNAALLNKIGMRNSVWTGYDLSNSARDLAKFGHLVMNNGVWNGEKLINDEGYFNEMLSQSQSLQEAYGYLWWLNGSDSWYDDETKTTFDGPIAPTMPSDAIIAKGYHDQRIYIVPSVDLVVIRQGMYTGLPESGEGSFDAELWRRIMNAIESPAQ